MRNRAAVVFSLLSLSTLWSCGSDSGNPTKPDPDPDPDPPLSHAWTPNVLGLPPADSAALDSAAARYRTLRMAGDAASARASLVSALTSGWTGVANAGVTVDGSTVQINFTDGIKAIIVTDETFNAAPGGQAVSDRTVSDEGASGVGEPERPTSVCLIPLVGPQEAGTCADAVVSPNHEVRIVNPAPATSSGAGAVTTQIRQGVSALGWEPDDIEVRQSTGPTDRTFTLDDILDQSGAGVVVFNAEGATVSTGSGDPSSGLSTAFAMQAFNVGTYEQYQQNVSSETWAKYDQWQKNGRLIHAKVWSPTTQTMVDQVFIREDLLAEEIELAENAMVHFNSPHSGSSTNLGRMVSAGGAASATGWDGFLSASEAAGSIVQLLANMAGGDGEPVSETDALDMLLDQGLTTLTHGGGESHLLAEVSTEDPVFLPAQVDLAAPGSCQVAGTTSYDIDVSYPACPALNQTYTYVPGSGTSLAGLSPVGAEISFRAKDAQGNTVGSGLHGLMLTGGPNDLDLCPCQGGLDLDFGDLSSVPGIDAGAQISGRIDYADASIPSHTFTLDVGTLGETEQITGPAGAGKLTYTLKDGSGKVLGTSEDEGVELRCDAPGASTASFGWIKFTPGRTWSRADSLFITGTKGDDDPFSISLAPGEGATQTGLGLSDTIQIVIVAETEEGEALDTLELEQVVEPGENEVPIEFEAYGVVLTASQPAIKANGETVTLSATVRRWMSSDTDDPTGSAVEGIEVVFSSDLGVFVGPSSGTTDSSGQVTVVLEGTETGIATITATAGGLADSNPANVEMVGRLHIFVDNRGADHQGEKCFSGDPYVPSTCFGVNCTLRVVRVNQEPYNGWEAWRWIKTFHDFEGPFVGDTLTFEFYPDESCPIDSLDFPPYDKPWLTSAWLHYYYPGEYGSQVSVMIHDTIQPLLRDTTFTFVLRNPQLPLPAPPRPSPFDPRGPEKFILAGFPEGWL